MYIILQEKYIIYEIQQDICKTRSQAKSSGIKLPEVHGISKNLDPNILPEK